MFATASVLSLTVVAGLAIAQPRPPTPPPPPGETFGGWLGVGMMEVDAKTSLELDFDRPHGVQVTVVAPGSPAEKGGLSAGDVVTSFRGVVVEGVQHFARLVRDAPVGRETKLEVVSGSGPRKLAVTIAKRKQAVQQIRQSGPLRSSQFDLARPRMAFRNRSLGAELEALEGQLARYFGVNGGVLVRSVEKDSQAAKAKLQAWDVITSVAGRPVDEPNELTREINRARGDDAVEFQVVRDRSAKSVKVPVSRFSGQRAFPGQTVSTGGSRF